MKSGKRKSAEGKEMRNQKCIRMLREKENYKYLGILEVDTIRKKEKNKERVPKKMRKLLETKLSSRNFIKGINIWASSPCMILERNAEKWTKEQKN